MRSRAASSPGGNGSLSSGSKPSERSDGIRPARTPAGSRSARGAPWTSRRSSRSHTRQNGVKTVNGRPSRVRGRPTSATKLPGTRRTSTPAASSASATRRSRATANGDTSEAKYTRLAPTSRASAGSASSGAPSRSTRSEPRGAQPRAQVLEAPQQELRPRRGREAAMQQAAVEHEGGHDAVAAPRRLGEPRVVVDAQVAAVPDDRGGGHRRCYGRAPRQAHRRGTAGRTL